MSIDSPCRRRQFVIAAVTGAVATAQAAPPPVATKGAGDAPAEFWTPERMRDAKPMPLPAPPEDTPPTSGPAAVGGPQGSPSKKPPVTDPK